VKVKARWLDRRISAPGPFLSLCTSEAEFQAALRHLGVDDRPAFLSSPSADATTHFLESKRGALACVVCLGDHKGRGPIEVAGLLVHEAVHVWQKHAEWIGERHPGVEQEAYAIQSIAQELMAEFARRLAAPPAPP
jgi:hypothetical protein